MELRSRHRCPAPVHPKRETKSEALEKIPAILLAYIPSENPFLFPPFLPRILPGISAKFSAKSPSLYFVFLTSLAARIPKFRMPRFRVCVPRNRLPSKCPLPDLENRNLILPAFFAACTAKPWPWAPRAFFLFGEKAPGNSKESLLSFVLNSHSES